MPSKTELKQLESLERQLRRLTETATSLQVRMVINGRDPAITSRLREVYAKLEYAADQIQEIIDGDR